MIFYDINAFTDNPESGNPAGVVICDNGAHPAEAKMQAIAAEVGYSETAFLVVDGEHVHARYFTPVSEVDLCGHATIASFKGLLDAGLVTAGRDYTLHAKAGELNIKVEHNFISMEAAQGRVLSTVKNPDSLKLIYGALGTDYNPVRIMPACNTFINMDPMVVTAGVPFLIVPINGKEILNELKPNLELIREISIGLKCSGIYCFAFERYDIGTMAHTRGFYPVLGIDEECATGTGVAALSHYLNGYGVLPANREALYLQGEAMGRLSQLTVYIKQEAAKVNGVSGPSDAPKHIMVGGDAVIVSKKEI